jgi:hypothetical protein
MPVKSETYRGFKALADSAIHQNHAKNLAVNPLVVGSIPTPGAITQESAGSQNARQVSATWPMPTVSLPRNTHVALATTVDVSIYTSSEHVHSYVRALVQMIPTS